MKREWMLKRNCSMSPRHAAIAYGVLCLGACAIGLAFALHGIWFVFAFALLEVAGIALALLHYARHATDCEHIALTADCLLIERLQAGHLEQLRLDPCWTRIVVPNNCRRTLIQLESRGLKVEVGSFVSETIRQQVAQELRGALRTSSFFPA
jgi:uncharacterized membrane protein